MGTRRRAIRRGPLVTALCAVLWFAAAGCSGGAEEDAAEDAESASASASESESQAASPEPSASPSQTRTPAEPQRTVIPIRVRGDSVEPRGERVPVPAGEPFVFAIDSDTAGELHVHATPEAQFAFGSGRTREQLTLDRPGIVDVELHEPTEVTVVQLEVR